jgi:putative acetyltransferase
VTGWIIRPEQPGDEAAIAALIDAAFAGAPHAGGNEAEIVGRLRSTGVLAVSLVAVVGGEGEEIAGQAAFSAVRIEGEQSGWYGLGPVAVLPRWQGRGIGSGLIRQGLDQLRDIGAQGCTVLGDPAFYSRLGFAHDPALRFPGPPAEAFRRILFRGVPPAGTVSYHPAFG